MTALPTLFKQTSTKATQQWRTWVEDLADGTAVIRTEYGQVGGKVQAAEVAVRAGKNCTRSNATTPQQQARLECEARWKKQKDKGYVESADAGDTAKAIEKRPMLAQDYAKRKDKVKFPCHAQPKLDGLRCLAHKDGSVVRLYSRMGKPIETVPHINQALAGLMFHGEVWDGELYTHGERFQVIASLVKKAQPGSERVQYHVYDTIAAGAFGSRLALLEAALPAAGTTPSHDSAPVLLVPTFLSDSHDDLVTQHNAFVAMGYEGLMVRHNGCPYEDNRRSPNLLKVKLFEEREYRIVGAKEGKGKFEGCCVFECETDEGARFDCLPEGTMEQRKGYWDERESLMGQLLTVRYFEMTSSEKPVPRFPIGKSVRNYE